MPGSLIENPQCDDTLERERTVLATVVRATDVMLAYLDPDFNFVWVNDAYASTCDYRPDEMVGKNHFVLYPHEENEAIFRRARDTGAPVFYKDKPFESPDQPERCVTYWDWSLVPVKNQAGKVTGLVLSLREATRYKEAELERQKAEETLRRERDFSTAVIETAGALVIVLDRAGHIMRFNRECERVSGYSAGEVLGRNVWELALLPPEQTSGLRVAWDALMRGESPNTHENEWVAKDGSRRVIAWSNTTNAGANDRVEFLIGTGVDITERRRFEEELKTANAQLVEADRRKNEFLAALSHELRNPLAPIRNSLYILERVIQGGDRARKSYAVIDRQVGHMTRLIDGLLDVTRITRGKIQLERELLNLNELARRTVEDHRSIFAGSGVQLEMRGAPTEVWVSGDRTRLTQAMGNLLENAVKFTPRGGRTAVAVEVDARRETAILRVRDTGAGIAPQILPRIFEPFTQGDTTLDRSKGGLGLGLALVKGLVELHGGTVRGESGGPEKGATFTITLPLATAPTTTTHVEQESRGDAPKRRVLVIEDNVDAADSLREALALGENVVDVAYSGPDGIAKARAFKPDVVLCDIGLPGMDGYDVARAMRADHSLRHISLVAVTGYAQPEDVARAKEAGFDSHLAKPPSMAKIEWVLEEVQKSGDHERRSGT